MCEMCVTVIYFFLLVKLIKFFLLSFFILLPVMVNKDIHKDVGPICIYNYKTLLLLVSSGAQ